jgi:hypothetical protein
MKYQEDEMGLDIGPEDSIKIIRRSNKKIFFDFMEWSNGCI